VTDFVTDVSGITYSHIKNAPKEEQVIQEIKKRMLNKVVVGHTTAKDLEICHLKGWKGIRKAIDIADCSAYSPGGKRLSLKNLALSHLGKGIQEGWHSSLEDAKATMQLFLKNKHLILK
jgi:RNA exonuclease 4